MPDAVAERLVERLAERDAGVLDGVVRARLEVALHTHVEVEQAVARHARRAGGRRSRPRSCARPRRVPSRSSDSWTSVSPVVRWICEVRLTRGAPLILRAQESPRHAQELRRRARGGQLPRRARIREPSAAGTWPARAPTGSEPRRPWAARGSSRRRSRRTRWPTPRADEQAAGVPHPVRERLGLLADELEVLRRELLGEAERVLEVARLDQPRVGVRHARPLRRQPLDRARRPRPAARRPARSTRPGCPARARPAPSGPGRSARDRLRSGRDDHELARARDAVDPHLSDDLPLRLLHVRVAGTDDYVNGLHRLWCRTRARRSPGRRPSGTPRSPRRARTRRGSPGARGRPARAARTRRSPRTPATRAGHGAHHDGRRIGRPPARHVDRRAPHRALDHLDRVTLWKLDRHRLVTDLRLARPP